MRVLVAITLLVLLSTVHCRPSPNGQEDLAKINQRQKRRLKFFSTLGCVFNKIGGNNEEVDIEGFNLRRVLQEFVNCLPTSRYESISLNNEIVQDQDEANQLAQELEEQLAEVEKNQSEQELAEEQFALLPLLLKTAVPLLIKKISG